MFPHINFIGFNVYFFTFIFLFSLKPVLAQKIFGEFSAGMAGGWWYYDQDKGSQYFDPALGNAYTESTPNYSFEGNLGLKFQKLQMGAGIGYIFFVEDDMDGEGNTDQQYKMNFTFKNSFF